MKIPFVLALSFLVRAVVAGGPQNCLERVWVYQSYLIDQFNPEAERQIGYQCNKWKDDECKGQWVPCRPKQNRQQCDFDDFQDFLGNLTPELRKTKQGVYKDDGSLDTEATAEKCLWAWRDSGKAPYNFRGYKTVRHGSEDFNDLIHRVTQTNNDNFNRDAVRTAAGAQAFADADDTLLKITTARVGDHGRYLLQAARESLPDMTIIERDLGANPYYREGWVPPDNVEPDPQRWKTVNWEATVNDPFGPLDSRSKAREFLNKFYRIDPSKSAKDHWQVLRSYKNGRDRTNRCRRHG